MSDKLHPIDDAALETVNGGVNEPCIVYVVKRGDDISTLARRYHTTVEKLRAINNMGCTDQLKEGQKLLIPYNN